MVYINSYDIIYSNFEQKTRRKHVTRFGIVLGAIQRLLPAPIPFSMTKTVANRQVLKLWKITIFHGRINRIWPVSYNITNWTITILGKL